MTLKYAASFLLMLASTESAAQVFSAGVKGGTPISESTKIGRETVFGQPTLNIRRYTLGPTVEVALPLRLRLQADFLYKRLDQTEHFFSRVGRFTITRKAGNSWEFPLALKYVWKYRAARPFAVAGGSIRRLNSFEWSEEERFGPFLALSSVTRGRVEEPLTQGGWVGGAGVRFDVGVVKISPEIRYTRWTSLRFLPTKNQVEFLLGVMF